MLERGPQAVHLSDTAFKHGDLVQLSLVKKHVTEVLLYVHYACGRYGFLHGYQLCEAHANQCVKASQDSIDTLSLDLVKQKHLKRLLVVLTDKKLWYGLDDLPSLQFVEQRIGEVGLRGEVLKIG